MNALLTAAALVFPNWQMATLPDAHQTEYTAHATSHRYHIQVATFGATPKDGYPVLYLLDGKRFFPSAVAAAPAVMVNAKAAQNSPIMIVGIDYVSHEHVLRAKDYTAPLPASASASEQQAFGGAEDFTHFLQGELKTLLRQIAPIDPQRQALFGHSYGGLFAVYTLQTRPQAFSEYLVVSPSIWWHNRRVLDFMPTPVPPQTAVRIGVGGLERAVPEDPRRYNRDMLGHAQRWHESLQQRGVQSDFVIYEGENHGTVPFRALHDGLHWLAQRWRQND